MENERVLPADDFLAAHTGLLPVQKRKMFPSPDALMSVVGRQKKKSQPPPGLLGLSLITKVKQNGKGSAVRSSRARWRDGGRISTKSKWEAIDSCCCVLCVKKKPLHLHIPSPQPSNFGIGKFMCRSRSTHGLHFCLDA